MDSSWLKLFLFLSIFSRCQSYRAAVVDYATMYDTSKTPNPNMIMNSLEYIKFIKEASKQGAEIIVFPEYGLSTMSQWSTTNELLTYSTKLPDENSRLNPCSDESAEQIVSAVTKKLSCAARNSNITLVVNLLERDERKQPVSDSENEKEYDIYSTTVVFGEDGSMLTKYRKYYTSTNGDRMVNRTKEFKLVTFEIKGVTFAIFSTYDLFLEELNNADKLNGTANFVFTSSWKNYLPFTTAIPMQAAWARANGVNLLASGYLDTAGGYGGSGIYSSVKGILNTTMFSTLKNVLISDVPTLNMSSGKTPYTEMPELEQEDQRANIILDFKPSSIDLSSLKGLIFENITEKREIKLTNFQCEFETSFEQSNSVYKYKFIAYQGNMVLPENNGTTILVQFCAIIACRNNTIDSCDWTEQMKVPKLKKAKIEGNFAKNRLAPVFPSVVTSKLGTLQYSDYDYVRNEIKTHIELKKEQNELITFGIFAITQPNNAISLVPKIFLIFISIFIYRL